MKKPFEMPFAEFADSVQPSGAVNRLPAIGGGSDVFTYSVYMNGPLAVELPADARDHEFKDVMLYALTDQLALNSSSFRDNLKVAELVATRSAWMSAVLEATLDLTAELSDEVLADYELLTEGMLHPWILEELKKQKALTLGLQPALDAAGQALGAVVTDRAPGVVTTGTVVSRNSDFTVQASKGGEVVTHENRRLGVIPEIGQNITVAYYRGAGQVFESHENLRVSAPYIDEKSNDLAVSLMDGKGTTKQVVLFSGVSTFAKFVEAQGLDSSYVGNAIEVREANPKPVVAKAVPKRELISDVYLDDRSGCLAVDYMERGGEFSALFSNAAAMEAYAKDFGLGQKEIHSGRALETGNRQVSIDDEYTSLTQLRSGLTGEGVSDFQKAVVDGRRYVGPVVGESALHVAQDLGRKVVVIHDKRDLDKVPVKGDRMTVDYENGRGRVTDMVRDTGKGVGR